MEEVGSNEVIPFNMLFSKCLVELKVPKLLRQLPAMELYDRSSGLNDHLSLFELVYFDARMPDNALVIAQEVITS